MFSVEIKVNSQLVGHIYCRNVGSVSTDLEDKCEYKYRYYEPESGDLFKGDVIHRRPDGIRNLVNKIINDVDGRE